jgi:uncharacterized protein (DUF1778 family)
MPASNTLKQDRMNIRLDPRSKKKLERAAAYAHKTLSEFVLGQALDAADEVIQRHETLPLSEADWECFLDALDNPPTPSARLSQAFADHGKRVKE